MKIQMKQIGFVRTEAETLPRHWSISDVEGTLEIEEQYVDGLDGIEPGGEIVVIFNFHESPEFTPDLLFQTPPNRTNPKGVFSICSPRRPNPIGLSILKVLDIRGVVIKVKGLDMFDGTPILDIKPHIRGRETRNGAQT